MEMQNLYAIAFESLKKRTKLKRVQTYNHKHMANLFLIKMPRQFNEESIIFSTNGAEKT